jgi:hypothetical protein
MARAKLFQLVLSPYVEQEIERALMRRLNIEYEAGSRLIDDYALAMQLINPERFEGITREEFDDYRHLIRHGNDVPVLVTAIKAMPDWLVTANVEHFNEDVALRTGLRIVTPHGFLRQIGIQFRS